MNIHSIAKKLKRLMPGIKKTEICETWIDKNQLKIFLLIYSLFLFLAASAIFKMPTWDWFGIVLLSAMLGGPFLCNHGLPLRVTRGKIVLARDCFLSILSGRRAISISDIDDIRITRTKKWDEYSPRAPYVVVRVLDKRGKRYRNMMWRSSSKDFIDFMGKNKGVMVKASF